MKRPLCVCICKHNHKDKQWKIRPSCQLNWTQPGAEKFNTYKQFDIPYEKQTVSKAEFRLGELMCLAVCICEWVSLSIHLCVHIADPWGLSLRSHFDMCVTNCYTYSWNLGVMCGVYFDLSVCLPPKLTAVCSTALLFYLFTIPAYFCGIFSNGATGICLLQSLFMMLESIIGSLTSKSFFDRTRTALHQLFINVKLRVLVKFFLTFNK